MFHQNPVVLKKMGMFTTVPSTVESNPHPCSLRLVCLGGLHDRGFYSRVPFLSPRPFGVSWELRLVLGCFGQKWMKNGKKSGNSIKKWIAQMLWTMLFNFELLSSLRKLTKHSICWYSCAHLDPFLFALPFPWRIYWWIMSLAENLVSLRTIGHAFVDGRSHMCTIKCHEMHSKWSLNIVLMLISPSHLPR